MDCTAKRKRKGRKMNFKPNKKNVFLVLIGLFFGVLFFQIIDLRAISCLGGTASNQNWCYTAFWKKLATIETVFVIIGYTVGSIFATQKPGKKTVKK
jgi:hypothetical protein